MARKHEGGENGVFELVKGRRINVDSAVRSLQVPTGEKATKQAVPAKFLHVDNDPDKGYKFMRKITVPCLPSAVTDENIGDIVQQFMADLRAYDAASEVRAVVQVKGKDGAVEDREVRGERTMALCVDKRGNAISAGEYIAQCIMGEHVLGLQKRFYKANLPKALAAAYSGDLTGEVYEKPPVNARTPKAQGEEEAEEITVG